MIAIDDLYTREDTALEINNQDNLFNIYEYCLQDEFCDDQKTCAIGMITPKQSFTCFSRNYHESTVECVLFTLYDDFNEIHKSTNYDWHQTVYEYNDICIQYLFNKDFSLFYILIYLPKEINKFQYSKLFELYDSINKINDYFERNGGKTIEIHCGYQENGEYRVFSLRKALEFMKDKITLKESKEEMEIVSRQEQMSRSLVKRRKRVDEYAKKTHF